MTSSTTTYTIQALPDEVFRGFTEPEIMVQVARAGQHDRPAPRLRHSPGRFLRDVALLCRSNRGRQDRANEDRYTARFVELDPPTHLVESITFACETPPSPFR